MVFRICAKVKNPRMQSKYTDSKFKQITLLFLPPTQKRQRKVNVGENNSMSGVSIHNICKKMPGACYGVTAADGNSVIQTRILDSWCW